MYLDRIVETKKQEVTRLKETVFLAELERKIATLAPCRNFSQAVAQGNRAVGLIAEVKKASPSKGLIRADFHPVELAMAYTAAGANCLSVLTDEQYFQGSNEYLQQIREHVDVPILRKDFTIDAMQIYEARTLGADAILLIAAILSDEQLGQFLQHAQDLSLTALVEVHTEEELQRVLGLGAKFIGINNRNLHTFVTDLKTTEQLITQIPKDTIVISESGISKPEEIAYLHGLGVNGVLVGEHFMRQPDIRQAVLGLMGPVMAGGTAV
ncbi:MAG: indole-3-glycerol phosphate synthase [Paenibacillus sp. RIFOXYA1_FULL_44_5]|nr:MAG: indole-3-glycerol phosphate synthase [Paenibacillus sp. RIFOXYA1_FULL_44_5]